MSQFIKDLTKPTNPFYVRYIKGSDNTMPEFSGKNVIFDGGGTLAGLVVSNSTNPLKDIRDYKYTSGVSSQYDYFGYIIDIPVALRGTSSALDFFYTASTSNFQLVIKDMTSGLIIDTSVSIPTTNKTYQRITNIPPTCTQIRVGWQFIGTSAGETFQFDNIVFSLNAWQVANLTTIEGITYSGYTSGAGSGVLYKTKDSRSKSGQIIRDDTSTYNKYTVLVDGVTIQATAGAFGSNSNVNFLIKHSNSAGTVLEQALHATNSDGRSIAALSVIANTGDYFVVTCDASQTDSTSAFFSITAQKATENIVQSYQDGMADWKTLTYIQVNNLVGNQGLGTFTAGDVQYRKDGSDLIYKGKLTLGTVSGVEARLPLPAGLISAGVTKIPSLQLAGKFNTSFTNSVFFSGGTMLTQTSVGYLVFGFESYNGAMTGLNPNLGSGFISGAVVSFNARIPIEGWSSTPTLLALPVSKENNKTYPKELVTVTGNNTWTTTEARFYPYRTIHKTTNLPVWRLAFNINGTTVTANGVTITVAGIVTSNTTQAFSGSPLNTSLSGLGRSYVNPSSNTFQVSTSGSEVTPAWAISGDVELAGKPTWADEWIEPGVFVGSVSKNQVAYIEDVKAQNVSAGSSLSGYNQRIINTLTGDTSFVSLSGGTTGTGGTANVFTLLEAGTYMIEAEAPAYTIGAHRVGIATSASGTPDVKVGTSEHAYSAVNSNIWSRVSATVTITTATSYKILQNCNSAGAGAGLGYATNLIGPEVYTRVKITKMNGN